MPYASVVLNLTGNTKTEILDLLGKAESLFPILVNLTTKEKKFGYTLGKRADSIHEKCKVLMPNNTDLLPSGFSVDDYITKSNDRQMLIEILGKAEELCNAIGCTIKALDQECTRDVLAFYKYAEAASHQNKPGAKQLHIELKDLINKRNPRTRVVKKK